VESIRIVDDVATGAVFAMALHAATRAVKVPAPRKHRIARCIGDGRYDDVDHAQALAFGKHGRGNDQRNRHDGDQRDDDRHDPSGFAHRPFPPP